MKKIVTLSLLLSLALAVQAQLPDGSTAPNFTATDINGRTWKLYDLLESGRPVIMDISATWCGPCWSYHNNAHLKNYYNAHGPNGDGKSMVFFVEGDGSTNLNCLYGPSGCVGGTQGNWVANTPYPIFDNSAIANDYDIAYFPTIYLICPDKTVRELGQLTAANLWAQASPCVANIPTNLGKIASMNAGGRSLELCGGQRIQPKMVISNLGLTKINNMTVELRWNGTTVQTKEVTDEILVLDSYSMSFDSMDVAGAGTLTAEITQVNGGANGEPAVSSIDIIDAPEKYAGNKVEIRIRTDAAGKDLFWAVYDENGTIFDQGGNTAVGVTGGGAYPNGSPASSSAYPNNLNIRDTITVPGTCFTFQLVDGAGNGLAAPGNVKLYSLGGSSFQGFSGNFGGYAGAAFAEIFSGVTTFSAVQELSLFPNPATASLTVNYELSIASDVQISVLNSIGQQVYTQTSQELPSGTQQAILPVDQFQNGLYYLQLQSSEGSRIARPFVVSH